MSGKDADALALLAWQQAMGADEAVAEQPADWFAMARRARSAAAPPPSAAIAPDRAATPPPRTPFAAVAPDEAVLDARARAGAARSLAEIEAALADFSGCALKATAKSLCFARGRADARLMLIGEAPGRDEDLQGKPFVGRAGQLLDRMLASIGLCQDDVYITNIVYWRPPGNRTPTTQEVEACRPFLDRQIELVDPAVVALLGGPAAQSLLGTREGIMRLRGKWRQIELGGKVRRVMPTLHPAYLLRSPAAKRLSWRDFLAIEEALRSA